MRLFRSGFWPETVIMKNNKEEASYTHIKFSLGKNQTIICTEGNYCSVVSFEWSHFRISSRLKR